MRVADVAQTQARLHLGTVVPAWRVDPVRAGQRLRALREAQGWSQQQLAARCGLSHVAISRLERGHHPPYAASVRALAHTLAVPPESFVDHTPLGLSTLTVAEAAARLEVPEERLREWLRHGLIEGTKISGQWRIVAITLTELERSGRLRGPSRRLDPRFRE